MPSLGAVRPALAALLCALALGGMRSRRRGRRPRRAAGPSAARSTRRSCARTSSALQRIADRDGGNRAAGTRGYADSARYVAGAAARRGLARGRRALPLPRIPRAPVLARPHRRVAPCAAGRDFRTLLYSGSGRAEGPLTTAGEGCTPADVAMIRPGAVVLVSPGGCLFRTKAANAERAGAAGLLIVDPARGREASTATLVTPRVRIPVMVLSRPAARAAAARGPGRDGRGGPHQPAAWARAWWPRAAGAAAAVVMAGGHLDSVPAGPGDQRQREWRGRPARRWPRATGRSAPGAPIRLAFWGAEELGPVRLAPLRGGARPRRAEAHPRLREPRHGGLAERGPGGVRRKGLGAADAAAGAADRERC